MEIGRWSVHLRYIANHPFYIGFPRVHPHNGKDGVDAVVLLAVDGLHVKSVDFENAEDISVLNEPLRNAVSVVPHIVGLLIEGEPVEGAEVHVA
jgi:hypothetical protein